MAKKHNTKTKRGSRPRSSLPGAQQEARARTAENLSALRIVKAFRGPNNKYINPVYNAISNVAFTPNAPLVQLLNGVIAGTLENQRVGRLTKNQWLDIDFSVYTSATAAVLLDVSFSIRAYVVVETTALGSAIAPGQFFVDANTWTPTSQRDRTNRNASRFVVLWDSGPHGIALLPGNAVATICPPALPAMKNFSLHLPLGFQTDYSRGNAGTIADIDTNSMYLLIVTDTVGANCTGSWTLCFNDDS